MLNLGLFMMPIHPAGKDLGKSLREDQELVLLADKLNFSESWMGEHYSSSGEPVPSPLIFNSSLINKTKKIKFGTGVISLPQQHPGVIAGHAALFDHLSKGRFIFGIGAGGLVSDWELFDNLDGKTRALTMIETVDSIIKIWESEKPVKFKGDYINFEVINNYVPELGIGKFIKPYQKPYPPIAVSLKNANSMTAKFAGQKSWIPISGNFIHPKDISTHWPTYKSGSLEKDIIPDPSIWRVGRSILITDSNEEADDIINDPHGIFTEYFLYLNVVSKLASGEKKENLTLSTIRTESINKAKELIIIGNEKTVLDKLIAFIDIVGPFGTLLLTGHDMTAHKKLWINTFEKMSENIKPIISDYISTKLAKAAE